MEKDFKINLKEMTLHVDLPNELSGANAPALQRELEQYKGQDIQEIVFDATELAYISSSGVRVIIFCTRELGHRPAITFLNCAKEIYESFELTGIHRFITFKNDVQKKKSSDTFHFLESFKAAKKNKEDKQQKLEDFAANNDVVMYQMKLGEDD